MRSLIDSSPDLNLGVRDIGKALAMALVASLGTGCVAELGGEESELTPQQGVFDVLAAGEQRPGTALGPELAGPVLAADDFLSPGCGNGVHAPGELCFQPAVQVPGVDQYLDSIEAGILTQNNTLDFVGSASVGDLIRIGGGNGAGGFSSSWTWTMGDGPGDVDYGDFNNDGFVDIVATNFHTDMVRIRWGASTATWSTYSSYSAGDGPFRVRVADLDDDGRDDFVTVNGLDDTIAVFLRQPAGGFSTDTYSTSDFVYDVQLADVDSDGDIDMVYAQENNTNTKLRVRRNDGNGAFGAPISTSLGLDNGDFAHGLTVGDWNEDGDVDVVVAINSHQMVRLLGNGNGTFSGLASAPTANNPLRMIHADMDDDGHRDLVIAHFNAMKISIFRGHGNGNFSPAFVISPGDWVNDLDAGDFDGDGSLDIVFGGTGGAYLIRSNP